jgi:hypothetical protein
MFYVLLRELCNCDHNNVRNVTCFCLDISFLNVHLRLDKYAKVSFRVIAHCHGTVAVLRAKVRLNKSNTLSLKNGVVNLMWVTLTLLLHRFLQSFC